ncbi:MAG TPA: suppressor of fused domain protein [Allosphingosinicella sp.]|nr:suppressor of fused domain protein [Allosphingosinicella sp.]
MADRNMWVYATRCMSQPEDESPVELHMFGATDASELVELLYMTAYFHRTAEHLDLGHSVNFGKPWLPGSDCDHGLISLPYLDGPKLEILDERGAKCRCYWLIPITASEVAFKRANGLDALEERFEQAQFNYLNPRRVPVA